MRSPEKGNAPFVRLTCEGLVNLLVAAGTSVTARDIRGKYVPQKYIDSQLNSFQLSIS